MKTIRFKTEHKSQIIDITDDIKEIIIKSGVKNGVVSVFCPHSTASVIIFEKSDPTLRRDLLMTLKNIVPYKDYAHKNARAHLKASLLTSNLTLIVENAKIMLGKWQSVFLVEFDGPRERSVYAKVIND
ncbi:secondary thiamine-phosphate synthase enzyme YjbQ [Lebetimonas sp. JS138]|uniref:secondary thiamine-phosphate synthase enzyme YjbQ n=1 Tax=Lebetimonas sp. JS138 TaxID=990072 RepID=UPI0004678623|nr:secondary thiamine-phosphate synthase enzyme YjbQ [Lebetimonas sp. JS138]